MPNKLSQFWQELKRRNVVRVITVYAGAAFVILELVDILSPSLGLPQWTLNLVLILLIVGFFITVIVSWIYDIQPEGGLVKTEPVHKLNEEETPKSSNSWKIASYISFVVIVGLIFLNVFPRYNRTADISDLETSIAVLPFENMSVSEEDVFLGNAFTDEIIMALQKIKEFERVLSFTSTMQFAENRPAIPEIAEKLNVNFLVEGSIQKYQGKIRVRVQVIRALNEDHIWGDSFDNEYNEPKDILAIQSRIAQAVAEELKVNIAPEEKQLIEKIPTASLTAYDIFQNARNEHTIYWKDNSDKNALINAIELYHRVLDYDSTYAQAYSGLALATWDEHYWDTFFEEGILDTILRFTRFALSYDENLEEAYFVRGLCYERKNQTEKALNNLDKALKINPNYSLAYSARSNLYVNSMYDFVEGIKNLQKAANLDHSNLRPGTLRNLGWVYREIGFLDKAEYYHKEALKLDNDTTAYLNFLSTVKYYNSDLNTRLKIALEKYQKEPTFHINLFQLIEINSFLGNDHDAYLYAQKFIEVFYNEQQSHRLAYAFWKVGKKEEAMALFDKQIKLSLEGIELNNAYASEKWAHYDLAAVYAFLGDKEKAFQYLVEVNKEKYYPLWWRDLVKHDPLFYSIRETEQFQHFIEDVEAKYQAEHERVRKWLEENEML